MAGTEDETERDKRNHLRLSQFHAVTVYYSVIDKAHLPRTIIERGIDINYKRPKKYGSHYIGFTLLHFAANALDNHAYNEFLNEGADYTIKNEDGNTALHVAMSKGWNRNDRKLELVKSTVSAHIKDGNTSNPIDKYGLSHFHLACAFDCTDAVEFFLKSGIPVNQTVYDHSKYVPGYTPLHFAVRYYHLKTVEILLKYGADMNIKDSEGISPLHLLIKRNLEIIDFSRMLEGVDSQMIKRLEIHECIIRLFIANKDDFVDDYGLSIDHIKCILKDEIEPEHFQMRKIKDDSKFYPGYTPLHFAAHSSIETVKLLLENGGDIFEKDTNGISVLDLCIERYTPAEIHSILSLKEEFRNILFTDGKTKLLDFILKMEDLEEMDDFLNLPIINESVPMDSILWSGYTPLHLAILFTDRIRNTGEFGRNFFSYDNTQRLKKDYYKRVQVCLLHGSYVNKQEANNLTPLELAFKMYKRNLVKLLSGYFMTSVPKSSMHFLIACADSDLDIVLYHLENEQDVNSPVLHDFHWFKNHLSPEPDQIIYAGSTALHISVQMEDVGITKLLLNYKANLELKNSRGLTPIHQSMYTEPNKSILNYLFSNLENWNDCITEDNISLLHAAAFANNSNAIEKLLDNNADIEISVKSNEKISWLPNTTPLHIAVYENSLEAVEKLLKAGADIHAKNCNDKSALHLAIIKSPVCLHAIVKHLILKNHDITSIDDTGITMLHLACAIYDDKKVEELLEKGADPNARINSDLYNWLGYTPLHIIANLADEKLESLEIIIDLLIKYGADLLARDNLGFTPLHSTDNKNPESFFFPSDLHIERPKNDIMELLLDKLTNYHINPVAPNGLSHFHLACSLDKSNIVEEFLKNGVDVNETLDPFASSDMSYSPLHTAVIFKCKDVIKILLENGADFNVEDSGGNTPLHLLCEIGDCVTSDGSDYIEMLFSMGAKISAENIDFETPLELLIKSGKLTAERVKYFSKLGCSFNYINPISKKGYIGLFLHTSESEPIKSSTFNEILRTPEILKTDDNYGMNAVQNIVSISNSEAIPSDNYADTIERLLKLGCELDHQDKEGKTALSTALNLGNVRGLKALLKLGADINIIDKNNDTSISIGIDRYLQHADNDDMRKIIKPLCIYTQRLLQAGLYVCKKNKFKLDSILYDFDDDLTDDDSKLTGLEELKKLENVKFGKGWTLRDFMSELGLIAEYPTLPLFQRGKIDNYFSDWRRVHENIFYGCVLMFQYRKAQKRLRIFESAMDAMISLINIYLPDMCIERIIKCLTNHELENLIEAVGENVSDMNKRLKTE